MNIDIGGGTSDILAFKDGNPELTTSFRFAGDNLYDDGLNVTQFKDNGILKKYQEIGRSMFDQGKNLIKHNIINYIMSQPNLRSADLMMFFLTQKEMVEKLKLDSDMQLIFLLHHAALFYHTAQIIKMKGCELPEKIGVSGNGAKLLEITNRDLNINKPNGLKKLVEKIFQHVYELSKKPSIDLEIKDNPKMLQLKVVLLDYKQYPESLCRY
ncbi:MAG: cell division FtsA domain-containing protein [Bacteroidetes bacterium]|nr:cell division FtsA domain-containing protein [Bacteroidota bacterium]